MKQKIDEFKNRWKRIIALYADYPAIRNELPEEFESDLNALLREVAEKSFIAGENHMSRCYSGGAYYPDLTEYLKQFTDNMQKP